MIPGSKYIILVLVLGCTTLYGLWQHEKVASIKLEVKLEGAESKIGFLKNENERFDNLINSNLVLADSIREEIASLRSKNDELNNELLLSATNNIRLNYERELQGKKDRTVGADDSVIRINNSLCIAAGRDKDCTSNNSATANVREDSERPPISDIETDSMDD